MSFTLFQKLSETELNNYICDIDLVLEFHGKWVSEINRVLICKNVTNQESLVNTDNHFSRWYKHNLEHEITDIAAFKKLGILNNELIIIATNLLHHASNKRPIECKYYDEFLLLSNELRRHLNIVKQKIKSDLTLSAVIMGKVFENAEEAVMITDANSNILHVNQAFTKVTQYEREEVIGKKPSVLHSGNQDITFYKEMWVKLEKDNRWQGEIWNKRKNGEIYLEWLTITAVLDDNKSISHYIGVFTDVSTKNEGDEHLYHLAHYDSLCNLPNRMLFYDRLRQATSRCKRLDQKLAVMYLDVDGFKLVNDNYGHAVGDELLQQISKRINSVLRDTDTVARIGGDEFTFIVNDIDESKSLDIIAQKLLHIINEPYSLHGNTFKVSASLGISVFPDSSENINLLVKQADVAMYKAKKSGKNCFKYYHTSMG